MALYYPPTQNGVQKTLDAALNTGVTASMTLNNVTNIQNAPGVVVINRIDTDGNEKATSDREYVAYTGTSGSTLTGLTRNVDGGSSDQDHAVGSVVEFIPDVEWANSVMDALDGTTTATDTPLVTKTDTQTLTNKTLTSPTLTSPTLTTPTIDTIASTRVNPRSGTVASSATPTINTDNVDIFTITALAADITSMTTNLSGTPVNGQKLIIRIKDDGTSRSITWGASFADKGGTLPTATTISKTNYVGLIYNSTDSIWDCVAAVEEA